MRIDNIESDYKHNAHAVLEFGADEIKILADALKKATEDEAKNEKLMEMRRDLFLVYEILRNSCIDGMTVEILNKYQGFIGDGSK